MNIWFMIAIVGAIVLIIGIMLGIINGWVDDFPRIIITIGSLFLAIFISVGLINIADVKNTTLRQNKEREQIVYQIEHLTQDSDKIKLNEWILTYNDWVNDVNTSKEMYGWCSWYKDLDMSEHKIIYLV